MAPTNAKMIKISSALLLATEPTEPEVMFAFNACRLLTGGESQLVKLMLMVHQVAANAIPTLKSSLLATITSPTLLVSLKPASMNSNVMPLATTTDSITAITAQTPVKLMESLTQLSTAINAITSLPHAIHAKLTSFLMGQFNPQPASAQMLGSSVMTHGLSTEICLRTSVFSVLPDAQNVTMVSETAMLASTTWFS